MANKINVIGSYGWKDSTCKRKEKESEKEVGYNCSPSSLKERALRALVPGNKKTNPSFILQTLRTSLR
jgi:hypothetical protein